MSEGRFLTITLPRGIAFIHEAADRRSVKAVLRDGLTQGNSKESISLEESNFAVPISLREQGRVEVFDGNGQDDHTLVVLLVTVTENALFDVSGDYGRIRKPNIGVTGLFGSQVVTAKLGFNFLERLSEDVVQICKEKDRE